MKFSVDDRVRVIAWSPPGTSAMHQVCGVSGSVTKIRTDDNEGSDGGYKVQMDGGPAVRAWWFRACDLVAEDSPCTCDNTMRHIPVSICPVHERDDFDPIAETQEALTSLIHDLEDKTVAEYQKRAREEYPS